MCRYIIVIFIIIYFTLVESSCPPPPSKFYVDCSADQSLTYAIQRCAQYGMTLLNLTNSSLLVNDTILLNQTLMSNNCLSYFWFSSGNTTGLVASSSSLGEILSGILTGVLDLVGGLTGVILCVLGICPATTTQAPITAAVIVCIRPFHQGVIQKCQTTMVQPNMRAFQFQFTTQAMYGGILSSFASRSQLECSSLCSGNSQCIGISYVNGICTFYI